MNSLRENAIELGLTSEEFERIKELLQREPSELEIGLFSAMWSEHCSYKSSKNLLKNFPTKAPWVLQGPGENAGVVDIGGGWAACFKIESHNHPSYIEPYQGAATGVGGIFRDIFTMGARPIASLNCLRFGNIESAKTKYLVKGVVAGIGDYGNCMGIPTVGTDVFFHPSYEKNPLVNAFALGLVQKDSIFLGRAEGIGNSIMYVGAKTGRDGIGGAIMASAEFEQESEQKRPTVQVGDPFKEKLLLEACLEVMKESDVVGIQDMGAAGLTCATFEMADRAGHGIYLNLSAVPLRARNMTPVEIMMSESQERMLLCVRQGSEERIKKLFEKWDLDACVVGHVIDSSYVKIEWEGKQIAEIPVEPLTRGAPLYDRPRQPPLGSSEYISQARDRFSPAGKTSLGTQACDLLTQNHARKASVTSFETYSESPSGNRPHPLYVTVSGENWNSPNIVNRNWVMEQFDSMVGTRTIVGDFDSYLIRVRENNSILALSMVSREELVAQNPFKGGKRIIEEAYAKLCCTGARPLALTNCLNFGNPQVPEMMWQLEQAILGMSRAAKSLEVPVVSGNVSLYNETQGSPILPTPVVVMLGLLEPGQKYVERVFQDEADEIYFLEGVTAVSAQSIRNLIQENVIKSARCVGKEGFMYHLVHSCKKFGAAVNLSEPASCHPEEAQPIEGSILIILTVNTEKKEIFEQFLDQKNIFFQKIGTVSGQDLIIESKEHFSRTDLKNIYSKGLEAFL